MASAVPFTCCLTGSELPITPHIQAKLGRPPLPQLLPLHQNAAGAFPALREVSFNDIPGASLLCGSMMPNKLEGFI